MTEPSIRSCTYQDSTKCHKITTRNHSEPPRSTAYYYADLERFKRTDQSEPRKIDQSEPADELSEYVEANDVINDGPIREVPPLRDRGSDDRKGETYSTAGTFPMPETKEKEPLLAELEVVGRVPLTQLDGTVRRSRSWFCCPDVEEEMSRESSWRYSSLRPVTAPPAPGLNGLSGPLLASQSSRPEDLSSLRAERDALARALAGERARAQEAARAHDARLAELHGVIAELVRRRAREQHTRPIPEEEIEESSVPEGEDEEEGEGSRTEQDSSLPSVDGARTPVECAPSVLDIRSSVEASPSPQDCTCDTSLHLSEHELGAGPTVSRGCARGRPEGGGGSCECERGRTEGGGGSCERERGSTPRPVPSPGRSELREAKLAARVRLRRAGATDGADRGSHDESWCVEAAEQLALEVGAQADLREALVAASHDGATLTALLAVSRARCRRLRADVAVLQCALANAADNQHRLYCACCVQEQRCVALCAALGAGDRALETYDVLLALHETRQPHERAAVELVARQLLAALDAEQGPPAAVGGALLSPGPWLQHDHQCVTEEWSAASEARLRAHAARLKADTVRLRPASPPHLYSLHDVEESDLDVSSSLRLQDMEEAVLMQEGVEAREAAALRELHAHTHAHTHKLSGRSRRRGAEPRPAETDL